MNQLRGVGDRGRCASWRTILWSGAAVLIVLPLGACGPEALTTEQNCNTGIYRLADGRLLDIGPSEGRDLRWRLDDGATPF